jgi:hypothetical protein
VTDQDVSHLIISNNLVGPSLPKIAATLRQRADFSLKPKHSERVTEEAQIEQPGNNKPHLLGI